MNCMFYFSSIDICHPINNSCIITLFISLLLPCFNFHSPTCQTYQLSPAPGECQLVLSSCDRIDRYIHRLCTRYQCEVYHGFVDILTIGESRVVRLPSVQPAFLSKSEPPSARSTCTDCPRLRRYLPCTPYMLTSSERTSSTNPSWPWALE